MPIHPTTIPPKIQTILSRQPHQTHFQFSLYKSDCLSTCSVAIMIIPPNASTSIVLRLRSDDPFSDSIPTITSSTAVQNKNGASGSSDDVVHISSQNQIIIGVVVGSVAFIASKSSYSVHYMMTSCVYSVVVSIYMTNMEKKKKQ